MVALARAKIKEGAVPWSSTTNPESSNMDDVPWDMSPIPPPPSATEAIEEDLAFDANPDLEIAVLETMEPKTGPELASQRLEAEPLPHQQHAVSTSSIPAETLNDVPGADQNKKSLESSLRSESASGSDSSSESSSSSGSSTSRSPSSLSSSSSSESSDDDNADSATRTTKGGSVYVGRKRSKPKPHQWKKEKLKKLVRNGKSHKTRGGNVIQKNVPRPAACDKCRMKCQDRFSEKDRRQINASFWALGNTTSQKQYIKGSVELHTPNRQEGAEKRRTFSRKYFLKKGSENLPVCRDFFLRTLHVSNTFVDMSLSPVLHGAVDPTEKRGWQAGKAKKYGADVVENIKRHIESFPVTESHYNRERGHRYLDSNLSMHQMYLMYLDLPDDVIKAKEWKYREVFDTYKIKFGLPTIDTCDTCAVLQGGEKEAHEKAFKEAITTMQKDIELAKNNPDVMTVTFDLQQVLPCPLYPSKEWFYKRKLNVYNLTVYPARGQCRCYTWHEGQARRGALEVASALRLFIKDHPAVKRWILWSDSCGGQNRNRFFVAAMLHLFSLGGISSIELKYLIPGHTMMDADKAHARIERAKRKDMIILYPTDWNMFIRSVPSRRESTRLVVVPMNKEDIHDVKGLFETKGPLVHRKKSPKSSTEINWLETRWIFIQNTTSFSFKYDFDEGPMNQMSWERRGVTAFPTALPVAYPEGNPISSAKKHDILSLCQRFGSDVRDFYMNLKTNDAEDLDTDE